MLLRLYIALILLHRLQTQFDELTLKGDHFIFPCDNTIIQDCDREDPRVKVFHSTLFEDDCEHQQQNKVRRQQIDLVPPENINRINQVGIEEISIAENLNTRKAAEITISMDIDDFLDESEINNIGNSIPHCELEH